MSDKRFHIEILIESSINKYKKFDCEMELRKWLYESPIDNVKFHGIEDGICGSPIDENATYNKSLEIYNFLLDFQPLNDISKKYSAKIIVNKPWNRQIKPYWFSGSDQEWIKY